MKLIWINVKVEIDELLFEQTLQHKIGNRNDIPKNQNQTYLRVYVT
jgi:hypothetical protein